MYTTSLRPADDFAARHGSRDGRALRSAVGEEIARIVRVVARLHVHIEAAAGAAAAAAHSGQQPSVRVRDARVCALDSTVFTSRGFSASRNTRVVLQVELRIARLDAKEKTVARSQSESRHVEYRMIRRRQAVHQQHPEDGRDRREQHGQFKRDGNERRPAIERPAADIDGIADHRGVILQKISRGAAA